MTAGLHVHYTHIQGIKILGRALAEDIRLHGSEFLRGHCHVVRLDATRREDISRSEGQDGGHWREGGGEVQLAILSLGWADEGGYVVDENSVVELDNIPPLWLCGVGPQQVAVTAAHQRTRERVRGQRHVSVDVVALVNLRLLSVTLQNLPECNL